MGFINQLFKGREAVQQSEDHTRENTDGDAASGQFADDGNRSFTYRPTGPDGVMPTPESPDRDSQAGR